MQPLMCIGLGPNQIARDQEAGISYSKAQLGQAPSE